jgi:hypothetical protein
VVDVIRSGEPRIEPNGLKLLREVRWPAYYLDFEAVMPPFPWFESRPPYDTVPFQYSLDICAAPGVVTDHDEYLASAEGDWRREFTERLVEKLGAAGSIIVYSSYEKARLKGLAELFPDLAPQLESLIGRLFDLEVLFRNGYIHPGFAGRTSIKKVLPVMAPGLGYDSLAIGNGTDAAAVFALMRVGKYDVTTHAAHRANLLEYCGLDTRAMVRLHAEVARLLPATE